MAAHTYWRLYIGAIANVYAQIGTVSFLNAAQVNQSIGGTATASSEYSGSWAAGNAFDGNPASEWASAVTSGPEWIAYQHPSPVDIVFVGVEVATSYPVSGLALQYSDDGVSWSAASPLYVLAGQPALDSGSYTVLGTGTSRRPLVLVDGWIEELPDSDTLPPQEPAAHSHATSDVTGLDAALSGKQPTISAGTTAQYWRGDKTWQTLNKSAVGLGNVDNTTDANKPVSTAAQAALDLKANLASPTLTGVPTAPTAAVGTNTTQIATTEYVFAERTNTATLTNKTLTSPIFNDGYTEEVFAVTGTAPALSPTNGSIQTWMLSGNSTPTAGTWASGQSLTLMVDDGSAYTINWASLSITWKTGGGTAPTLLTSGYTVIELVKVGSTIYGWIAGDA